ncbi:MAG: hypothetical protein MJ197_09275 [Bacteroidales bacterium]|nr:hypothetical protein [Bacteroidales bacterium]
MKKLLFIIGLVLLFSSCAKKNPIVFQKKSAESEVNLSLDTNGTFLYTAQSTKGVDFREEGTYTIEDSVLILRFRFESYEKDCYEVPLPNDTSLILKHKGKIVLFPLVKVIPGIGVVWNNNAELMDSLVQLSKTETFDKLIGARYFEKVSGDMSLIFNGNWHVSPFYDKK